MIDTAIKVPFIKDFAERKVRNYLIKNMLDK